jgi:predicted DNA-binding protein with PD1-like motif
MDAERSRRGAGVRFERFGNRLQVRFESGDQVMESLLRLLRAEGIGFAAVTGLGAVRSVRLSYLNTDTKSYETHELEEQLEVVSLLGNAALRDGQPFLHLHISLGRRDLSVFGGHFNEAVAHPTLEVWLQPEERPVHRVHDEASGLALMDLSERLPDDD